MTIGEEQFGIMHRPRRYLFWWLVGAAVICFALRASIPLWHRSRLYHEIEVAHGDAFMEERTPPFVRKLLGAEIAKLFDNCDVILLDFRDAGDVVLEHASFAVGLRRLSANYTRVTDRGVNALVGLPSLEYLGLSDTNISDAALTAISRLSSLTELDLGSTQISDRGLSRLGALGALECLDISDTRVSDIGLKGLASLRNLTTLNLRDTDIGDGAIGDLSLLTTLLSLDIAGTRISTHGEELLRRALPGTFISRRR